MEFQTRGAALQFLRAHQPMPSEADIDIDFYEQYGAAIRFFCAHPDPECLPLLLFSVRIEGSPALAQDVLLVLQAHDEAVVLKYLTQAMAHPVPDVRALAAEYALHYPRVELVDSLRLMLRQGLDKEIEDAAYFVVSVLEDIVVEHSHWPALETVVWDFYRNPRWTAYIQRKIGLGHTPCSDHLLFLKRVIEQAHAAFEARHYKHVVDLLEPFENEHYGFLGYNWPRDPSAELRMAREAIGRVL